MKIEKSGLTFTAEDNQVWVDCGEFCSSLTVAMGTGNLYNGENEMKLSDRQIDICEKMEEMFTEKGLY